MVVQEIITTYIDGPKNVSKHIVADSLKTLILIIEK